MYAIACVLLVAQLEFGRQLPVRLAFSEEILPQVAGKDENSPELGFSVYGRRNYPINFFTGSDYKQGYGINLEGELLYHTSHRLWIGPFLGLGWDRYAGINPPFGNVDFVSDPVDLYAAVVGFKMREGVGKGFFFEQYFDVGVAHYSSTYASGSISGVPFTHLQLLADRATWTGDLGARCGWGIGGFAFDFGFRFHTAGNPKNGKDFSSLEPDETSMSGPAVFSLDLGIRIVF